jgi:hypothetical protein
MSRNLFIPTNCWTARIIAGVAAGIAALGIVLAAPVTYPLTGAATQKATTISEGQIHTILEQMQAASNKRDTKTIMKFLAPNATVLMTIEGMGQSQTMSLTRSQYYQYLQQGFYITENYQGTYADLKIQVMPDRKAAIATYVLNEEVTIKSQPGTIVSSSDATMKFEVVKDKILVTQIKSKSRLGFKKAFNRVPGMGDGV